MIIEPKVDKPTHTPMPIYLQSKLSNTCWNATTYKLSKKAKFSCHQR